MTEQKENRNTDIHTAVSLLKQHLPDDKYAAIVAIVNSQPDQLAVEPTKNTHDGSYWLNTITEKGAAQLWGKIRPTQQEAVGLPHLPGQSPYNAKTDQVEYSAFDKIGDQGFLTQKEEGQILYGFSKTSDLVDPKEECFVFLWTKPAKAKSTLFCYRYFGHPNSTPDIRNKSDLINFNFYIRLPYEQSLDFIKDIEDRPELIDEIFMSRYLKMVTGIGPKRIKVNRLVLVPEVPEGIHKVKDQKILQSLQHQDYQITLGEEEFIRQ